MVDVTEERPRSARRRERPRLPIHSDDLLKMWEAVQRIPGVAEFAGELVRLSVIVDANVILELLRWHAIKQRDPTARSALLELLDSRMLTLYAPLHLWDEVAEKLPVRAVEWGTTASELQRHWDTYAPRVRWLELHGPFELPPNADRDPDDHAYLQLQRQHPDLPILTRDRDIGRRRVRQSNLVADPTWVASTSP